MTALEPDPPEQADLAGPAMQCISVDLPEPEGPSPSVRPSISAALRSRVIVMPELQKQASERRPECRVTSTSPG